MLTYPKPTHTHCDEAAEYDGAAGRTVSAPHSSRRKFPGLQMPMDAVASHETYA